MFGWVTKFRDFWKSVDDELESMYAERDEYVRLLARDKAGYNRQDRRHLEGFVPAKRFPGYSVKIYISDK